jgi:hypothetical protein
MGWRPKNIDPNNLVYQFDSLRDYSPARKTIKVAVLHQFGG